MSYTDVKIGAYAYMSAIQIIPVDTLTKIAFNATSFDSGSVFDVINHRFIAPITGLYNFNFSTCWNDTGNKVPTGTEIVFNTVKNGSIVIGGWNFKVPALYGDDFTIPMAQTDFLDTGDYLELFVLTETASVPLTISLENYAIKTFFSGYLS